MIVAMTSKTVILKKIARMQEYEYLLNNFIDTFFFSAEISLSETIFVDMSMNGCNWFLHAHGRYLTNLFLL